MKKIFTAIILGIILIPQLAMAQASPQGFTMPDESIVPGGQDAPSKPTPTKCEFTNIDGAEPCISPEEREKFQYIVLEEQMETSEQVNEYKAGESQIRSCQRMIQVSSCSTDKLPPSIKSKTKYVPQGKCTPKPKNSNNDRVICEDVTFIMTPLKSGGAGLLSTYVGFIYRWAAGIVGVIAVFIIILNSILIITAQDDQGAMDEAKKRIYQALAGIAILFMSALILNAINPDFFQL